jgi:conserved oligomeric Golgi complex subunit 5
MTVLAADQAVQAAQSLQLLLREDPLLVEYGLTKSDDDDTPEESSPPVPAYEYAAALLVGKTDSFSTDRALDALSEVERKLALVESLATKLSRTSPEAVAGHLLRLHGYGERGSSTVTLAVMRERVERLNRSAESLESVASRVEQSLQRGYSRMDQTTQRLTRVLGVSQTLKQILRYQFECTKLRDYDLDLILESIHNATTPATASDYRDLTRAAASVAVIEELDQDTNLHDPKLLVVQQLRPAAQAVARSVRLAAQKLLENQQQNSEDAAVTPQQQSLSQLGSILQVYYHLGELPAAVWYAVDQAHQAVEQACRELWNPAMILQLADQARRTASAEQTAPESGGSNAPSSRDQQVRYRLKQLRRDVAQRWSSTVMTTATRVRNLQRVLVRKTDPVRRERYLDVVAAAPVPEAYARAEQDMQQHEPKKGSLSLPQTAFSVYRYFWFRFCHTMGSVIDTVLQHDGGAAADEIAALYPAVRAAALELTTSLLDSEQSFAAGGVTGGNAASRVAFEEALGGTGSVGGPVAGVLGESFGLDLEAFGGSLLTAGGWESGSGVDNPQAATSADTWTRNAETETAAALLNSGSAELPASSFASLATLAQSIEWAALQGNERSFAGLYPLQQAFLDACSERLASPLQYMFPENIVNIDEDGTMVGMTLSLLPSKYDIQRFDDNIRQELSLADPREGGGDLSLVTMIAECVVDMIGQFCVRTKVAMSGAHDDGLLNDDWTMTESLHHDRKIAAIMHAVAKYLRNAPDKTFVAPYRPAVTPQHQEAANICKKALAPALQDIDKAVSSLVLFPLCRALNYRISKSLGKIHLGAYREKTGEEDKFPAFVQQHLSPAFEKITSEHLSKFPAEYASILVSRVSAFTVYAFVSNAMQVRPLGESARLQITQDLTDLELVLGQFVSKADARVSLEQVEDGKPYTELRGVRQLLYWTGLDDMNRPSSDVVKSLLRETWTRDVRPSSILLYLYSFAPKLLSSPHHVKRVRSDEYVTSTLVHLDGSVEAGEDNCWIDVMSSCDSYHQRASSTTVSDGDSRIAQVLLDVGRELLRRRGHYT